MCRLADLGVGVNGIGWIDEGTGGDAFWGAYGPFRIGSHTDYAISDADLSPILGKRMRSRISREVGRGALRPDRETMEKGSYQQSRNQNDWVRPSTMN